MAPRGSRARGGSAGQRVGGVPLVVRAAIRSPAVTLVGRQPERTRKREHVRLPRWHAGPRPSRANTTRAPGHQRAPRVVGARSCALRLRCPPSAASVLPRACGSHGRRNARVSAKSTGSSACRAHPRATDIVIGVDIALAQKESKWRATNHNLPRARAQTHNCDARAAPGHEHKRPHPLGASIRRLWRSFECAGEQRPAKGSRIARSACERNRRSATCAATTIRTLRLPAVTLE